MTPDRTLLIAGSGSGIGRALAEHYVEAGHTVFGFSRRDSDLKHERYRHFCADAADSGQIGAMLGQISAKQIDVLIYCAAINFPKYALLVSDKEASDMLRTNLLGAFVVTRAAVRAMKRRGFGRVIYLSSIAVPLGHAGSVIYGASKSGLEQMAFSLSREFPKDNITFNALGISIYPSQMLDAMGAGALDQARSALVKSGDLDVAAIAHAINFFASTAAAQITGQTLYFGGVR